MPLKLLIADVYSNNGRNGILGAGGSAAGSMFTRAVRLHQPDADLSVMRFDTVTPELPAPLDAYDGVIWSGSNLTIHRRNPLIDAQVAMVQSLFDRGIPQFGCCYGIQLATVAAGGSVEESPTGPEVGWARGISLTGAGRNHPMFAGKDSPFDALCWHNDAVRELPEGAELLAGNAHTRVQAAVLRRGDGEFWATQYHLEFDGQEVANLVSGFSASLTDAGSLTRDSVSALLADMRDVADAESRPEAMSATLRPVADPLIRTAELGNWLGRLEAAAG
jgi:GMP synthase (glutamine-hydrolysing)